MLIGGNNLSCSSDRLLKKMITQKIKESENLRIVTFGGGHGSEMVLAGLSKIPNISLSHIVAMSDNGGSSKTFREIPYCIGAPGDYTRCLLAVSSHDEQWKKLADYRFSDRYVTTEPISALIRIAETVFEGAGRESTLSRRYASDTDAVGFIDNDQSDMIEKMMGFEFVNMHLFNHSVRNLLYVAAKKTLPENSIFLETMYNLFDSRCSVIPNTWENPNLNALLEDGSFLQGESAIDNYSGDGPDRSIREVFLSPDAGGSPETFEAIRNADMIILCPGDLYTSTIASILPSGISEAFLESCATKVYVCNLMTKNGETSGYSAYDHVAEINKYISGYKVYPAIDHVLLNNKLFGKETLSRYLDEGSEIVCPDHEAIENIGINVIKRSLYRHGFPLRHDPYLTAQAILEIGDNR